MVYDFNHNKKGGVLNNKLRKIRRDAELSMNTLAKQVGCSHTAIDKIEKGSIPNVHLAKRIEKFFGRDDIFFDLDVNQTR